MVEGSLEIVSVILISVFMNSGILVLKTSSCLLNSLP